MFLVALSNNLVIPFQIQESAAGVLAGVLSLCQTCPNSVLVNDVLNNEVVTGSIVAFIETRSNGESVKLGLRVLIGVLSLISDELEDPPTVVTLLSNSVGLFAGIIADPADMDRNESFVTTTGPIARGFGFVRLGVLELLVSLLYTGFPIAVQCMLGERVFTIVLDLLFEYPWNNIIHNQISQLFSGLFCCNDPTIISSVSVKQNLEERAVFLAHTTTRLLKLHAFPRESLKPIKTSKMCLSVTSDISESLPMSWFVLARCQSQLGIIFPVSHHAGISLFQIHPNIMCSKTRLDGLR